MLARILVSIGGLLVVALFAALIAPFFVDWTNFRMDFEREATRIMGKPVVVHGSVDARLIPFPSVTLNDVRVGESEDGQPLIEVARFSMDAELAPFLSGEALIFDMRLDEPKARIRLLPDGTLDWARGRRASIPAKTVILENVSITNGSIDFIDEQTGRTRRVDGLSAELSAKSLAGPWRVEGRAALDGEAGSFLLNSGAPDDQGTIGLKARLTPDARPFGVDLEGDLKIVDFRPLYQGTFTLTENRTTPEAKEVSAANRTLPPRVGGRFELTNERIRVPEYRVEVGPSDDPYVITGEATLDTGQKPEFLLIADGQQIDVSRIGNAGEAGKTGRDPAVSIRQRLSAMMAIAADIPIPQVPGRASLKLPAIVIGDTTVRDVRLDLRPDGAGWLIDKAVALFPGRTQIEANGRLNLKGQLAFRGDLLVASNQPSGLASWLAGSVDPAIRKLRTAGFSATVNLTDRLQQFERLEIAAGPASLSGRIERQSFDDAQPSLSMQLKGNRIDLEALQALAGLVAGDASIETVLSHAIAADLSADTFTAFGEEAHDVQAVLTLKNGQIQAERVSVGELSGAKLALSGRMGGDLVTPVVSAKMKLASDDLTPFFEMLQRHASVHPMLARLSASGGYFTDAALDVTLTAGGKDEGAAVTFGVIGTANGSRIAARYQAPDLAQALDLNNMILEATLENPSTSILLGQTGFDPLPFDADANGILSVKLKSTEGTKANGSLTFTTDRSSLSVTGDVDLSSQTFLAGKTAVTLQSQDLEQYLLLQGIGLPQMGRGLPLALKAAVETTPEAIAVTGLEGKGDGNGFTGALTLGRAANAGKASGALKLDTLDLGWIAEAALGPVEDAASGSLSSAPLSAPAFAGFDASIDLTVGRVATGLTAPVADFSGKLIWNGDQVEITEASGGLFGGKLTGRLLIGNSNGSGFLQSKIDIAGGDLARTGWTRLGNAIATGAFNLSLALEGSGTTVKAMAQSASGSGTLTADNLAVRGLNSAALPTLLTAADTIEGEIAPAAIQSTAEAAVLSGETTLGKASIPFTIAGGTLRAQNVTAGDAHAALTGEVAIDLPESRIDGRLQMRFLPGEEVLTGADPQVAIGYAGNLAAPGVTLDVTDLANFLSLRAFERERRRVETLQANVLEKQRLRREVALVAFNATTREAERLRAVEEARKRDLAAQELKRLQAEEAARAAAARLKAEAEKARLQALEAARQEAVRIAAEKQAAEKLAAEKRAAEKAAADKLAAEKRAAEAEAKRVADAARQAAEAQAAAERATAQKAAAEKAEAERVAQRQLFEEKARQRTADEAERRARAAAEQPQSPADGSSDAGGGTEGGGNVSPQNGAGGNATQPRLDFNGVPGVDPTPAIPDIQPLPGVDAIP